MDGYRYPKDAVLANCPEKDFPDQYRDLKDFYKYYVGKEVMNRFIIYTDMKKKYPIQVIDFKHQVDHKTPKKCNCSKNLILILLMLMRDNLIY